MLFDLYSFSFFFLKGMKNLSYLLYYVLFVEKIDKSS